MKPLTFYALFLFFSCAAPSIPDNEKHAIVDSAIPDDDKHGILDSAIIDYIEHDSALFDHSKIDTANPVLVLDWNVPSSSGIEKENNRSSIKKADPSRPVVQELDQDLGFVFYNDYKVDTILPFIERISLVYPGGGAEIHKGVNWNYIEVGEIVRIDTLNSLGLHVTYEVEHQTVTDSLTGKLKIIKSDTILVYRKMKNL